MTHTHLKYKHGIERPDVYKEEYSLKKIVSLEVRERIAYRKRLVDDHALGYIRRSWGKRSLREITAYLGVNATTVRVYAQRMGLGLLVERWNSTRILRSLRRAHRLGLPLNSGAARKGLGQLYKAAIKYFRSWRNALSEAGIPYEDVSQRAPFESWSRERILGEMSSLHQSGRSLTYTYLQDHHAKLYSAARNHFGSWRAAWQATGLSK